MKVGILTLPPHFNYGGVIQNWAMHQLLLEMGHTPETIFLVRSIAKASLLVKLRRCASFLKRIVTRILLRDDRIMIRNPFRSDYNPEYMDERFVASLSQSPKIDSMSKLQGLIAASEYQAFVVGSDQVWRQEYSPRIETFFLDFLADDDLAKKIAYSVSFGKKCNYIASDKMPLCRELIKRFDAVSVREDEGLDILKNDFGYDKAIKTLDPTLLISPSVYDGLIKQSDRAVAERYIAAYILDVESWKTEICGESAERLGCGIKWESVIFQGRKPLTISQWLAMIADSEFVVTDSFHGCIFSIIFRKPFITIVNNERGRSRFVSLLGTLGLEGRMVCSSEEYTKRKSELFSPIDYSKVEIILTHQIEISRKFLSNALND